MSRVGNKAIVISETISVTLRENVVSVKGPKGELSHKLSDGIDINVDSGSVKISRRNDDRKSMALHGLNRMLIANMVKGVSEGYAKELTIEGVGFKGSVQDRKAVFSLGFSAPVELLIPNGVDLKIADNVNIVVSGIDKQAVGDFAARIKKLCPAEPYKGKGVRFKDERIRRKAGKTVA